MTRYERLEQEINKGMSIDEKSNEVIKGWSPNNVKRLIIGVDYIVVEYYVTGGKYGKLREIVKLGDLARVDYEKIKRGEKVEKLLKVLTAKRVISGVEEIVFCVKGYPQELLKNDSDISVLGREDQLKNRYVRLESVGYVNSSVQEIVGLLDKESKEKGRQVTVKEVSKGGYKELLSVVKGGVKGTNLRGRWYSMDKEGGVLYNYFQKEKERQEKEEKERRLKELERKKYKELAERELKPVVLLTKEVLSKYELMKKKGEEVGMLDKLEWGEELTEKQINKRIKTYLESVKREEEVLSNRIRRVDMDKLDRLTGLIEGVEEGGLLRFERDMLIKVLKVDEGYKREANKLDIEGSIEILNVVTQGVLKVLHDTVILTGSRYVNRGGERGIELYRGRLGLESIKYSRATIERLNKSKVREEKLEDIKRVGELVEEKELGGVKGRIQVINQVLAKL